MPALRVAFVLGVVLFAWLGLRGRFDDVVASFRHTSVAGLVAGLALVLLGLSATGLLWLRTMAALGARLPVVPGLATFFVGQLGKYIPGSVWSIGAQAGLARRDNVPTRVTVAAGLLFLGYHVDTAVHLGAGTLLAGGLDSPWPAWVSWVALVVAVVGLLPAVVRLAARRVAGRDVRLVAGRGTAADLVLVRCLNVLMPAAGSPAVAAADPRLVAVVGERAAWYDRPPGSWEHVMPYGVRPAEQQRLVASGATVRVAVPSGHGAAAFVVKRLAGAA